MNLRYYINKIAEDKAKKTPVAKKPASYKLPFKTNDPQSDAIVQRKASKWYKHANKPAKISSKEVARRLAHYKKTGKLPGAATTPYKAQQQAARHSLFRKYNLKPTSYKDLNEDQIKGVLQQEDLAEKLKNNPEDLGNLITATREQELLKRKQQNLYNNNDAWWKVNRYIYEPELTDEQLTSPLESHKPRWTWTSPVDSAKEVAADEAVEMAGKVTAGAGGLLKPTIKAADEKIKKFQKFEKALDGIDPEKIKGIVDNIGEVTGAVKKYGWVAAAAAIGIPVIGLIAIMMNRGGGNQGMSQQQMMQMMAMMQNMNRQGMVNPVFQSRNYRG